MPLQNEILRTLLYYDIWAHPLDIQELYAFLPVNSMTLAQFKERLSEESSRGMIAEHAGFYFVCGRDRGVVESRRQKQRHAHRLWRMARLSTHIIKRFPFVRAVFVSGDLSKNATHKDSDVDFFIITEPGRLWITRSMLILFKKIFLFNSKKYFCLNYFATPEGLALDERNIYTATEVATLKPLYNSSMFLRYLKANSWIHAFFPNFAPELLRLPRTNDRQSILQRVLEYPFRLFDAPALDRRLMRKMETVWAKRYPAYDRETRSRIFKCSAHESRAYGGNFEERILELYKKRLRDFGLQL